MKTTILLFAGLVFSTIGNQAQTITDYDGNVYDTVTIGNQVWMKQNLTVTHYNNGFPIPNITDGPVWANLLTGARCYYDNDSVAYDSVYGALYNWYVVIDDNNICPEGWHVSANTEWQAAEAFLGGIGIAGGKMKEAGTTHWASPNTGATNSSGFTGLPGGLRLPDGDYGYIAENGLWWTSTPFNNSMAWGTYLWYLSPAVEHDPVIKNYGVSIRCVKDASVGLEDVNDIGKFKLYPIPAKNNITCSVPAITGNIILSIFTVNGEKVIERQVTNNEIQIDISALPRGVYFVRLQNEKMVEVGKMVKE
jgi:uncharacterized protein (TIGR02145 family)